MTRQTYLAWLHRHGFFRPADSERRYCFDITWRCIKLKSTTPLSKVIPVLLRLRVLSALLFSVVLLAWGSKLAVGQASAPAASIPAGRPADKLSYRPVDPSNPAAFEHFYNLDYDRAVQDFDQVLRRHPGDPFAVNHLLTAVMFRELYRMGVLDTGEYAMTVSWERCTGWLTRRRSSKSKTWCKERSDWKRIG